MLRELLLGRDILARWKLAGRLCRLADNARPTEAPASDRGEERGGRRVGAGGASAQNQPILPTFCGAKTKKVKEIWSR